MTTRHRIPTTRRALCGALLALTCAAAAPGAAAAADPGPVLEEVAVTIDVQGYQHVDWSIDRSVDDNCTGAIVRTYGDGEEDLNFSTKEPVVASLKRYEKGWMLVADPGPGDPIIRTEASVKRQGEIETEFVTPPTGPGCDGGAAGPPVPPDCGFKRHKLFITLGLTAPDSNKLFLRGYTALNRSEYFKNCPIVSRYRDPILLEVPRGTQTEDMLDENTATIYGSHRDITPRDGGQSVTTMKWTVDIKRLVPIDVPDDGDDRDDEDLAPNPLLGAETGGLEVPAASAAPASAPVKAAGKKAAAKKRAKAKRVRRGVAPKRRARSARRR